MLFATAMTVLMLAVNVATPHPRHTFMVRMLIGMLCFEIPLMIGAVVFIILAETGRV